MNYSNHYFSLDIHEVASQVSLTVKKNETNRKLNITLTENGQPYEIGADCAVVFSGKKADGKILYNECLVKNNVIEYIFTPQTASDIGIVECEIIVYGGDSQVLYSPSFSIVVYTPSFNVDGEGSEGGTGGGISEAQVNQKITEAKSELIGTADDEAWVDTIKGAKQLSLDLMNGLEDRVNRNFVAKTQLEETKENLKNEAVQEIITELQGLPVFGIVDENNIITVTSQLSNGTYTLKYENEDGTTTEIGSITIGSGIVEAINLLPTALTPDNINTVFDGKGYKNGYYASAAEPFYNTDSAFFCTGLMPIPANNTFYVKGCNIDTALPHTRFGMMSQDGSSINTATVSSWATNGVTITVTKLGNQYYSIHIGATSVISITPYYFYFSASGTGDNVFVSTTPIE